MNISIGPPVTANVPAGRCKMEYLVKSRERGGMVDGYKEKV
ncbi:hypothetical protein HMPREF3293_01193 [Christensenella minuta]|uniref:Uncharacterized protein n=1 Tax=Christensenella minuta TaxID=626937 RepID=A0A136Q5F6_9FIRM|nr:hypothetical protein HMPREF3293_01193 [Christensenella minuta]